MVPCYKSLYVAGAGAAKWVVRQDAAELERLKGFRRAPRHRPLRPTDGESILPEAQNGKSPGPELSAHRRARRLGT